MLNGKCVHFPCGTNVQMMFHYIQNYTSNIFDIRSDYYEYYIVYCT